MEGIIFDIQKFALHDGPGIRTAVFIKGCPLRCAWCCNPESQKVQPQLSFEKDKCTFCKRCVEACPLASLRPGDDELSVDFAGCSACGECLEDCATHALRVYGYKATTDDILAEVLKDKDYYDNSGGGITLSGGEAMVQFEFALDLLKKAKENGLNTAIETSGYAATAKFEQIMPYVDLFLYDYKHTGNDLHRQYTGVDQDLILENLDFLYANNANILIRCPVIPGINDTDEHFKGITELSQKYPNLKGIEILGYHDYGMWKYECLGMKPYPITAKTVPAEKVKEWNERISKE
jgi:pyruvate formate lyase activating enzyme